MIPRRDLLDSRSPDGLEVFQLTTDFDTPACHVYMESQIFTPDSKRFLLQHSNDPHGVRRRNDPRHKYLLCCVETGELTPVTDETGVTSPSVTPDGKRFYYFVDETIPGGGGRLVLKCRDIDGLHPEIIMVVDHPLPGTRFYPSRIYPLSTISSDGTRIAVSAFLGDGQTAGGPFGLMVFDIPKATVSLIIHGPSWCNMHSQYSRSHDPVHARDILIQENHGNYCDATGNIIQLVGGKGADIHVIRDDGMNFRDMPWGRNGDEQCQGHQCWRGRSEWAITSTVLASASEAQLIESKAVDHLGDHDGLNAPAGIRNHLSREFKKPDFWHFATDIEGRYFITDNGPRNRTGELYFAELGEPGGDPLRNLTYLLQPRTSWKNGAHIHPFLSPDGSTGFFNSDESGALQAYMIRGLLHSR